jgi:quercetin dioxygenase-like cupin family protein
VNETDSSFEEGFVPEMTPITATNFFIQKKIEKYETAPHTAPRYQYVITLKGKLKFTVTNGDTFVIEPGILLIANDLHGKGHTWEILDGDVWERVYIVLPPGEDDHFVKTTSK